MLRTIFLCPAANFCFLAFGAIVSLWVQRIGEIQHDLGLSDATLGLVFLAGPVGSLIAAQVAKALLRRWPVRCVMPVFWGLCLAAFAALPFAPGPVALAVGVLLLGAGCSGFDILLNAQTQRAEERLKSPLMMYAHAMFPAGFILAAGLGFLLAGWQVPLVWQFGLVAAGFGVAGLWGTVSLCSHAGANLACTPQPPRQKRFHIPHGMVLQIALLSACVAFVEGANGDWTSVFLKRYHEATPAMVSAAFMLGSLGALLVRLVGERIVQGLGALRTIQIVATVNVASWVLYLLAPNLPIVFLAIFAGAGIALVTPLTYRLAAGVENGRSKEANLADVSLLRTVSFTAGPALIGWVSHWATLGAALWLVVVANAVCAVLATRMEPARQTDSVPEMDVAMEGM